MAVRTEDNRNGSDEEGAGIVGGSWTAGNALQQVFDALPFYYIPIRVINRAVLLGLAYFQYESKRLILQIARTVSVKKLSVAGMNWKV